MARRRFLPSLRTTAHPAAANSELKVVLGDYYSALAAAGVWSSTRARPWPVERAVSEGYERLVYVFRSVEAISGQASRLPFRLKQGEDVVDDDPLYLLLNKKANPMETGRQFRKRLGAQVLLSKRGAFVQVTKARNETPLRLDLLPPGRTRPVPGRDDAGREVLIDHYEVIRADGTPNEIPADEVIWFREPHPTDPYSGVTPLESAGMSAELDFFARLYNVMFLKNDGRPGGIIGINGDIDDTEMDRIERKFGHGPAEAGKMTVIAGDISYVDSTVRPRDMAYGDLATTSKTEILTAFGVPESVLGYAANRTFDNASQEHVNFWQITMPPHLDLQVTGFDELSDPELEGFFDVSKVEALQAAEAAKRAEKKAEFEAGLITPDEYRIATGRDPFDRPGTRCLYIASSMTPVATSDADEKALAAALAPPPGQQGGQGGPDPGDGQPETPDNSPSDQDGTAAGEDGFSGESEGDGETKAAPAPVRVIRAATPPAAAQEWVTPARLRLLKSVSIKAVTAATAAADGRESAPDAAAHDRLEAQLAATLTALATRWTQRTAARLSSPKTRKGTRHWAADATYTKDTRAGTQPLDAGQVVDGAKWQDETRSAVTPVIEAAAVAAAAALAADLASDPADRVLSAAVQAAARYAAGPVIAMTVAAAAGLAAKAASLITAADQAGQPIGDITTAVQGQLERDAGTWAQGVAVQAATATIAGATDAAAQAVAANDPGHADRDIIRVWRSRRDNRVRDTHQDANGQTQPVGTPFVVGDSLLRYPGDPSGPPGETYNCRCHLNHKSVRSGQYVTTPAGQVTRARVFAAAAG